MNRQTFIISGDNFSNLDGFYDEVQRVLTNDFKGFGRNFDAFSDILRGGFGRYDYEEKIRLVWKNSNKSKEDLGFPETIRCFTKALTMVHPTNINSTRKRLELAEHGEGQTLFDILLDIIKDRDNVELILT